VTPDGAGRTASAPSEVVEVRIECRRADVPALAGLLSLGARSTGITPAREFAKAVVDELWDESRGARGIVELAQQLSAYQESTGPGGMSEHVSAEILDVDERRERR